ncbi:hypothetical protein [Nocardioides nanhaiensis]|uniref:Secreted protein n=1 Tax=Nocardioides nanhaiensis TaxID=1476871 RepID=A0ABP8VVI9_9ACTN
MKLKNALVALSVAAATSATAVVALPGGAAVAASSHLKVCASDNYTPTCYTRTSYDGNWHNDPCDLSCGVYDSTFGDDISSYKNNSPYWWKMYHDKSYKGYTLCVRPWGYDANMGDSTPSEDDISSVKRQGTSQPTGCDKVVG